jgi:hypothetical protein
MISGNGRRSCLAFVALAIGGAILATVALVLVWLGFLWLTESDPTDPTPGIEQFYDADVESCLLAAEVEYKSVWICSFYRMGQELPMLLREGEPDPDASASRVACLTPGFDSDAPSPLGFAAPDRLTFEDRCREEIEDVRRLLVDVEEVDGP